MKVLLIDNYDSFTYNLVHYLEYFGADVDVFRNDEIDILEIEKYKKIVLSPGPGIPDQAGILKDIIKKYHKTKSILGICLGQQAIAEVFGGSLKQLTQVVHGVSTQIKIIDNSEILFKSLPETIEVGRYHSWVVNPNDLPEEIQITSTDQQGNIMSLKHTYFDVRAVQFHPESIMTPTGKQMIENWLNS